MHYVASIDVENRPELLYERLALGPARSVVEFSKIGFSEILIINGDLVLSSTEFARMSRVIDNPGIAYLVVHKRVAREARSLVEIDREGYITSIKELDRETPGVRNSLTDTEVLSLSGIYKLPTWTVTELNPLESEPLSPKLINFVMGRTRVRVFQWSSGRFSIDSVENLHKARAELNYIN
jgi:hypothetical protein